MTVPPGGGGVTEVWIFHYHTPIQHVPSEIVSDRTNWLIRYLVYENYIPNETTEINKTTQWSNKNILILILIVGTKPHQINKVTPTITYQKYRTNGPSVLENVYKKSKF